ncbi:MAG TPA: PAS domain-containing protein, partial [Actinomycetota bacterium]|nr:PAS domain-containing protein [Actinomycetota bacterium]
MDRRILVASGLLDALHVGVVLTDSRGRPLRANAAAQRLLGCQPDGSAVSEQVLAIAREALRSGTAREQEPMLGQTALRVRATPIEGGAVVELDDVSLARRTQHAYHELLAAVGATLLDRVEPLGLLVEALTAADDPEHATRVFRQLGEEANALVDLIGSATASEGHERVPESDRAGPDLDPTPPITGSRPFSVDQPIVLLVHPADGLVEALTTGLSQADLSTIAAKDVHQALQTLETMQPDAVVLHCPQGNLTAADAYAKVRAVTNAPVVLLVGGNEPLAAELTDGSAHEVLVLRRPLRLPELVAALHTVMSPPPPASSLGSLGS